MSSAGFLECDGPEGADIIIVNTCGFIEDAKKESIDVILEAAGVISSGTAGKPGSFGKKLAVAGCLSQRYAEEMKKELPEADFIYGVVDDDFVRALCSALNIRHSTPLSLQKPLVGNSPSAYIKIAEGCSNNCSYCAIPLIRGPHRSYAPDDIIRDVETAAARGVLELNIVAQDIAAYRYGTLGLPGLIGRISSIEGPRWIRLLYCHPDHIDDGIIGLLGHNPKVARYVDIPFQHASGRILESMGRKGDTRIYLDLVDRLRRQVPDVRIRSTFMVGYPGEKESDFRELLDFLRMAQLDRVGCFTYSPEEGTAAEALGDNASPAVKRSRKKRLMELQMEISRERMRSMIGMELDVLVEEPAGEGRWLGRSEFDAPEVDGIFFLTAEGASVNSIVRAVVTGAEEYDLIGTAL